MNGSTPLTTEQPRLIVLMGYPASGKTTLARHMQDRDLGLARVNRDDIRSMIGLPYNRTLEAIVRWIEVELVRRLLANGISVIVDDTNLKWETRNNWGVVAGDLDAIHQKIFVHTPMAECIRRDNERENSVGASVIRNMAKDWEMVRRQFEEESAHG